MLRARVKTLRHATRIEIERQISTSVNHRNKLSASSVCLHEVRQNCLLRRRAFHVTNTAKRTYHTRAQTHIAPKSLVQAISAEHDVGGLCGFVVESMFINDYEYDISKESTKLTATIRWKCRLRWRHYTAHTDILLTSPERYRRLLKYLYGTNLLWLPYKDCVKIIIDLWTRIFKGHVSIYANHTDSYSCTIFSIPRA